MYLRDSVRKCRLQLQTNLSDNAECTFRPNEELAQVRPSARLLCTLTSLDHGPVSHHDGQVNDILPHRAIPDGVGTACTGADHTANLGAWPRIGGKEEAAFFELVVEHFVGHARLNDDVEVVFVELDDGVHVFAEGETPGVAHRELRGLDEVRGFSRLGSQVGGMAVTFERSQAGERDQRYSVLVGSAADGLDLLGG